MATISPMTRNLRDRGNRQVSTKACQAEVVKYLMERVLQAEPGDREKMFNSVKLALDVWLSGRDGNRTHDRRNAVASGFRGVVQMHYDRLNRAYPRSQEWLKRFCYLKLAFEKEALDTVARLRDLT